MIQNKVCWCVLCMRAAECSFLICDSSQCSLPLRKKATIHQVTVMLATSKNVLFLCHNHLVTTDTDDPTI